MDDPSDRVDKADGRNDGKHKSSVSHIIAHSFTHTSSTDDFIYIIKRFFIFF